MEMLFVILLLGLLPAYVAMGKGKNFLLWWLYGTLLFPFAMFHAIAMRPSEKNLNYYGMKYCLHCRKPTPLESTECQHCGKEQPPLKKEEQRR